MLFFATMLLNLTHWAFSKTPKASLNIFTTNKQKNAFFFVCLHLCVNAIMFPAEVFSSSSHFLFLFFVFFWPLEQQSLPGFAGTKRRLTDSGIQCKFTAD